MFDLEKAERNMIAACDLVERMNAPNPLNPAGLSDLAYSRVMTGLHDDTWVRSFVPEATKEIMQNVDAGISSRGQSPLTETRGISG